MFDAPTFLTRLSRQTFDAPYAPIFLTRQNFRRALRAKIFDAPYAPIFLTRQNDGISNSTEICRTQIGGGRGRQPSSIFFWFLNSLKDPPPPPNK